LDPDQIRNQDSDAFRILEQTEGVTAFLPFKFEQVSFRQSGGGSQTASLFVLDEKAPINSYFRFNNAEGSGELKLGAEGALISRRLATIFNVGAGDFLTMTLADQRTLELQIAGVVENFLGHNLYLSEAYFEALSQGGVRQNAVLFRSEGMSRAEENQLSEALLASGEVQNTTFSSVLLQRQEAATQNLGSVVLIFIVLSGTLAFVVLYNLTNINLSERERELATMKVLGFFDREVTLNLVRENLIFTFFGILIGFGIGNALTWFIIETTASDQVIFPLVIHWPAYVISALMTCLFSGIVMWITHGKLQKIQMIEALKSME
jgi:putative ABC transport system permease protein